MRDRGMTPFLNTNGYLLTKARIRELGLTIPDADLVLDDARGPAESSPDLDLHR